MGQIGSTLFTLAVAFGLAVFVGLYLGMAIGAVRVLKLSFEPILVGFLSIPKVLFVTIFWTIFGFGFFYKMSFAFLHGVIPISISVIAAMSLVDKNYIRVANAYGASRLQLFTKVYTPAIAFVLLGSLRIAFNLTLIGLILAEYFVGTTGLGYALREYAGTFSMSNYYGVVFLILAISVAVNLTLLWVERKFAVRRGVQQAIA